MKTCSSEKVIFNPSHFSVKDIVYSTEFTSNLRNQDKYKLETHTTGQHLCRRVYHPFSDDIYSIFYIKGNIKTATVLCTETSNWYDGEGGAFQKRIIYF